MAGISAENNQESKITQSGIFTPLCLIEKDTVVGEIGKDGGGR
jgi:hypothetical protein